MEAGYVEVMGNDEYSDLEGALVLAGYTRSESFFLAEGHDLTTNGELDVATLIVTATGRSGAGSALGAYIEVRLWQKQGVTAPRVAVMLNFHHGGADAIQVSLFTGHGPETFVNNLPSDLELLSLMGGG